VSRSTLMPLSIVSEPCVQLVERLTKPKCRRSRTASATSQDGAERLDAVLLVVGARATHTLHDCRNFRLAQKTERIRISQR
jgi:hypothetical protein